MKYKYHGISKFLLNLLIRLLSIIGTKYIDLLFLTSHELIIR